MCKLMLMLLALMLNVANVAANGCYIIRIDVRQSEHSLQHISNVTFG